MILKETSLAELVRKFPAAAAVFEKYDLDYCCGGKKSLQAACPNEAVVLEIERSLHRIIEHQASGEGSLHVANLSAGALIDHIINKHHAFIKENAPVMQAHLEKVVNRHGAEHPELPKILELFMRLKLEMEQHMFKEEYVLFPRIKALEATLQKKDAHWDPAKPFIDGPIQAMEAEHDLAGKLLHEIKVETGYYELPVNACTTYRLCYDELKQFEQDMHQHVHLENNILFPMALSMQQKLSAAILN